MVIPNGVKEFVNQQAVAYTGGAAPADAKIGGGNFVWSTSGSINQRFWGGHAAIDIGAWTGAPVKAADGGYVALATAGWKPGYGNHVIIDHGNGFSTLYAHLNSIFVKPGESVAAGQQIGSVGNTGNSTKALISTLKFAIKACPATHSVIYPKRNHNQQKSARRGIHVGPFHFMILLP